MSDADIIDGKAFALGLRERIGREVAQLQAAEGITPGLAVVLVGDDPASQVYVRNKNKSTIEAGMNSWEHRMPATASHDAVMAKVHELNADDAVDGILVQLPLPAQVDALAVLDAVDPAKDVDGFHVINVGRLSTGQDALVPCTPLGCTMLLKDRLGELKGLEAVIVGRSNIVGKPMAQLLLAEHCTVTVSSSRAISCCRRRRCAACWLAGSAKRAFASPIRWSRWPRWSGSSSPTAPRPMSRFGARAPRRAICRSSSCRSPRSCWSPASPCATRRA